MARVLITISYEILPEKREEYLNLTREMKVHVAGTNHKEYAVFEQKGRKNSFTELFVFSSMEEYDQMEDQDELMSGFMQKLESYLAHGKMKYSTLIELQ